MSDQELNQLASLLYLMTRFAQSPSCQIANSIVNQFEKLNQQQSGSDTFVQTGSQLATLWRRINQNVRDQKLQSRLRCGPQLEKSEERFINGY